ncbi:MAG: 50S ribosomal protein L1 [Victivallaceae bacterium]
MTKCSKRMKQIYGSLDFSKSYSLKDAVGFLKSYPSVKFDQTLDFSLQLGIDPKKSDQQIRGSVSLPHGTGKKISILVFAAGEKAQEALSAGADFVGSEDLIERVKSGWVDFDVVVATPDMMREVGKLGKILGPRSLMPTPKAGTVTNDVSGVIGELRRGKIEFKSDRSGVCNAGLGKLSFSSEALCDNVNAFVNAILKSKPSSAKGQYFVSCVLSSTMGPGVRIDFKDFLVS